jgi:CubicO group peptidase (beta-lactamase class C family)
MRSLVFLISILIHNIYCQEFVYPASDWEVRSPESQNVDSDRLLNALNTLKKYMSISQTLLIKNGYAIWKGSGSKSKSVMASSTKTVTSTMLGVLVTLGKIKTSDAVSKTYPGGKSEWRKWASFSTSGSFNYSATHMENYSKMLTYVANKDLLALFKEKVGNPIGMKSYTWGATKVKSRGNVVRGGAGDNGGHFATNAEDWARLCYLYLRKGYWRGSSILDEKFVEEATSNQANVSGWGGGRYGYNLWLNTKSTLADAPQKTFWSWGRGGRTCVVIPEWDIVFVRLGKGVNEGWNLPNEFFKSLKESLIQD